MLKKLLFHFMIIVVILLSVVSCKAPTNPQVTTEQTPSLGRTKISYIFPTITKSLEDFQQAITITKVFTTQFSSTPTPTVFNSELGLSKTPNPTISRTVTPEKTLTPIVTQIPSPTPTWPVGWVGQWTVYYGGNSESLKSGSMIVNVTGITINAVAVFDDLSITLNGELSADGQKVYGTYVQNTNSGVFYWEFVATPQFGGNLDNQLIFCAARPNSEKPQRCGIFFPS